MKKFGYTTYGAGPRKGWRGNPYGHALAARGVRLKPKKTPSIKMGFDSISFKRRGKIYETDLRSDALDRQKQMREVSRIKKMPLSEIKRKYGVRES